MEALWGSATRQSVIVPAITNAGGGGNMALATTDAMLRIVLACLLIQAALALVGCGHESCAPVILWDVELVTDRLEYTLVDTVWAEVRNLGDKPIYWMSCSPAFQLERRTDDSWDMLGAWYYYCLGPMRPVEIGAHDVLPVPLLVFGSLDFGPGTYRIRAYLFGSKGFANRLPDENSLTLPFLVSEVHADGDLP